MRALGVTKHSQAVHQITFSLKASFSALWAKIGQSIATEQTNIFPAKNKQSISEPNFTRSERKVRFGHLKNEDSFDEPNKMASRKKLYYLFRKIQSKTQKYGDHIKIKLQYVTLLERFLKRRIPARLAVPPVLYYYFIWSQYNIDAIDIGLWVKESKIGGRAPCHWSIGERKRRWLKLFRQLFTYSALALWVTELMLFLKRVTYGINIDNVLQCCTNVVNLLFNDIVVHF